MPPAALPWPCDSPVLPVLPALLTGRRMPPAALPLALWQPSIGRMPPAALPLAF